MARPRKCWSARVGDRGHSVTIYERTPGGPLWLRWWVPATPTTRAHWHRQSLDHRDRGVALEAARAAAAGLLTPTLAAATGRTTVAEVLAAYWEDHAKHTKSDPKEVMRRMDIWTHFLGATREVATVDFPTLDRFVRERRAGTIKVPRPDTEHAGEPEFYDLRPNPSNRAIAADIEMLQAALNHATRVVRPNGVRLVAQNPVGAYPLPKNATIKRPVATYDRFEKLLTRADEADPQKLFSSFMSLVEGLGWRVSAICQLRACDVDRQKQPFAPFGRIYRRPETDKTGAGGWLPMSESVRGAVDRILAINPAIGEWPLFPAPRARTAVETDAKGGEKREIPKPWSRHYARKLLERTERLAELAPLDGSDFHAFRRKWATERKHLPAKDVAAAGMWRSLRTLETAYTQTDEATVLAVITEPRKLREQKPDAHAAGR